MNQRGAHGVTRPTARRIRGRVVVHLSLNYASELGIREAIFYVRHVIGFLRFVGLLNAAIWFGAGVFFTVGAGPAVFGSEMKELLGPKNYPYFSGAIAQIIIARYFRLQIICGLVALVHLFAEWLYLGKAPRQIRVSLIIGLVVAGLIGASWIQPKLKELHAIKYGAKTLPAEAQTAAQSFKAWHGASQMVNLGMLAGLAVYLWGVASRDDTTRFVSTNKFRG